MKETSLKPVIEKLESLFSKFNEKFYNNELQTPVITVSPDTTKGAYGWCTAWKAWTIGEQKKVADLSTLTKEDLEAMKKDDGFYEINICAEHLARPFEQVAKPSYMKWFTFTICKLGFRTQAGAVLTTTRNTRKPLKSTV